MRAPVTGVSACRRCRAAAAGRARSDAWRSRASLPSQALRPSCAALAQQRLGHLGARRGTARTSQLQVEPDELAHPVAQRAQRRAAGQERLGTAPASAARARCGSLYCRSHTLQPATAVRPSWAAARPKRSLRLRAKPRRERSCAAKRIQWPHMLFDAHRHAEVLRAAAWPGPRGAGCARPAARPGAGGGRRQRVALRLQAPATADGSAEPGGIAVVVRPVVLHRRLRLRPGAVEQRQQRGGGRCRQSAPSVGSACWRRRSRTYSVRCSGIGPCGPNRPKKRTPGAARLAAALEDWQAAGAKSSSGSWPRRSGSRPGRSARPKRGASGRSDSTRRSSAKKSCPAAPPATPRTAPAAAAGAAGASAATAGSALGFTAGPAGRGCGLQRITSPRCGVRSVSCANVLIAAWRAKKRSSTLAEAGRRSRPGRPARRARASISMPLPKHQRPGERQAPHHGLRLHRLHARRPGAPRPRLRARHTAPAALRSAAAACCGLSPTSDWWFSDSWLTRLQPSSPRGRRDTGRVGPRSASTRFTGPGASSRQTAACAAPPEAAAPAGRGW